MVELARPKFFICHLSFIYSRAAAARRTRTHQRTNLYPQAAGRPGVARALSRPIPMSNNQHVRVVWETVKTLKSEVCLSWGLAARARARTHSQGS